MNIDHPISILGRRLLLASSSLPACIVLANDLALANPWRNLLGPPASTLVASPALHQRREGKLKKTGREAKLNTSTTLTQLLSELDAEFPEFTKLTTATQSSPIFSVRRLPRAPP
ncbi:hypothetical protein C8J56DRAFT_1159772 [Mycena floridula]|nr:hypothetical protein C8J56DRAFT_1159772 [Mycena floridula]